MKRSLLSSLLSAATLALLLLPASRGSAQTPSDLAPALSFCFGESTHCVMPDFNLSTVSYDLDAKKWATGVARFGAGYALLFYSDQPWSFGVSAHFAGQLSQSEANYLAVMPSVVVARYLHVGTTLTIADGYFGKALSIGVGAPLDLLSGKTMGERVKTLLTKPSQ